MQDQRPLVRRRRHDVDRLRFPRGCRERQRVQRIRRQPLERRVMHVRPSLSGLVLRAEGAVSPAQLDCRVVVLPPLPRTHLDPITSRGHREGLIASAGDVADGPAPVERVGSAGLVRVPQRGRLHLAGNARLRGEIDLAVALPCRFVPPFRVLDRAVADEVGRAQLAGRPRGRCSPHGRLERRREPVGEGHEVQAGRRRQRRREQEAGFGGCARAGRVHGLGPHRHPDPPGRPAVLGDGQRIALDPFPHGSAAEVDHPALQRV